MRIIHTSDWHLGQHFIGKSRQAEHQALIAWLLLQVRIHQVDAVLIAGDIFDTGNPPSYARELYNSLILGLRDCHCQLIVLAGNHDSVATLTESRDLLARLGTIVIPVRAADPADQLIVLNDRSGQPAALLCAIPFIRPRDVMQSMAGQSADDKKLNLQQAIHDHYLQLHELALQRRTELGKALPIISSGHLTTVGASSSESVREIYVGTLDAFPTSALPPADYIALGHIHRPQRVGGHEHIRYCGSPIPLSFDELGQTKQMLLVEFNDIGLHQVSVLEVPLFQPLASLSGNLKQLAQMIASAATNALPERPVWLEVVVSSDDYLSDLQQRVQALVDGLPVELLRVRRARNDRQASLGSDLQQTLDELNPEEVFARRLEQEQLEPALSDRLMQRYRDIVQQIQGSEQ